MVRLQSFKPGDYIKPHPDTKQSNYHTITTVAKALVADVGGSTAIIRIMEGFAYDKQRSIARYASGSNREMHMYQPKKWVLYEEVEDYEIW